MADFVMPLLGADMEKGTLVRWLVKPGDIVKRGDLVAEIETEKAAMDIEVFVDGTVEELIAGPGDVIAVGGLMARIGETARVTTRPAASLPESAVEAVPAEAPRPRVTPAARVRAEQLGVDLATVEGSGVGGAVTRADVDAAASRALPAAQPSPVLSAAAAPAAVAQVDERARISPRARRVAAELGVDLSSVTGSGPDGSVVEDDVRRAATAPAPVVSPAGVASRPGDDDRSAARKRAIGALMARSKREVPHYYLGTTIDMKPALDWLAKENRARPISERLLPPALLIRAVALATKAVPGVNGHWVDDHFIASEHAHVGVATSLRDGSLLAPAILDADTLSVAGLMEALRDVVTRARNGQARASEMSGATITVTNLGDQGVEWVYPVIFPPQVAMVGFGKVIEQPWAENGMLAVRPVVKATLAADHRATNGHEGGRFLAEVARLLQQPEKL